MTKKPSFKFQVPALTSVDKSALLALIGKIQRKKIVVIGDVMLDVYIKGSVARISPEAPIPVVEINEKDKKMPGGAANVAANITALGGHSTIIGAMGRDSAGRELAQELKASRSTPPVSWPWPTALRPRKPASSPTPNRWFASTAR